MGRIVDTMRTRYVRLPPRMKQLVGPALRILPPSLRFGSRYHRMRREIRLSESDPDFVRDFQLAHWRQLIGRSQNTSYYSELIRIRLGPSFRPSLSTLDDLQAFPILTKQEIADGGRAFLTAAKEQFDVRQTSGSSGRPPAEIYLDRDRSVGEAAFLHHIWSRIGYRPTDGRAVLRDYAGNVPSARNTWRYDPGVRELWLSPFHLMEPEMDRYLSLLRRYRVRFLSGIPSAIFILAQHALKRKWRPPPSLRGILTASESLFSHQRELIMTVFGVQVIAQYGMTERVAMAGEYPNSPDVFEFEPLYGIVELLDENDQPVETPGQQGRLVCTGLFNKAMSLIRYEVGDTARLVQPATHDNCYRMRVSEIRSRWNQEFVVGRNGQKISVNALDQGNYFGVIREYQYAQSEPGSVLFRAVPCEGKTAHDIDLLLEPIRKRVREEISLEVQIVSEIPVGSSGKRNFVDQRCSIGFGESFGVTS